MKKCFPILPAVLSIVILGACSEGPGFKAVSIVATQNPAANINNADAKVLCSDGDVNFAPGEAAIFGGGNLKSETWLAKGIVMVVENDKFLCTGSLIADNLVLTAAHCVDTALSEPGATLQKNLKVYFTSQPECEMASGAFDQNSVEVIDLKIHPSWNSSNQSLDGIRGDLALVKLKTSAPKTWKPLKLAKSFVPMDSQSSVVLSGYGLDVSDINSQGQDPVFLRIAFVKPLAAEQKLVFTGLQNSTKVYDNQLTNEVLFVDQREGQGVCAGDSGGPSLMKDASGKYVVTGVASFVTNPKDPKAECGFVAAHTSVVFHQKWIADTAKALGVQVSF